MTNKDKTSCTGCPVFTLCLGEPEVFIMQIIRCSKCGKISMGDAMLKAEPLCREVLDNVESSMMLCIPCLDKKREKYMKEGRYVSPRQG